MKINVKDPLSDQHWICEAKATTNEREKGWSVVLPAGNSIFLILQQGIWKVRHDETVHPNLSKAIGEAITLHFIDKK